MQERSILEPTLYSWLTSAAIAALVGAGLGGLEGLLLILQVPWHSKAWPLLGIPMLQMASVAAVFVTGWWLAALLGSTFARAQNGWIRRAPILASWSVAYVVVGFHVNNRFFPKLTAPSSLAFDFLWTLAFLWGGWWLLRTNRLARSRLPSKSSLGAVAALAALAVLAIIPGLRLLLGVGGPRGSDSGRASVLLIVMDTTRADHLSSYGYAKPTSPNVDRIASEGATFEQASASGAWTMPTHASMFTGLLPREHGADWQHELLEDGFKTIAEHLSDNGYQTFGFSNNPWISSSTGFAQGFDVFEEIWDGGRIIHRATISRIVEKLREVVLLQGDQGANRIVTDISLWLRSRRRDRPFFVFANFLEPHMVYEPPQPFRDRFAGHLPLELAAPQYQLPLRNRVPPVHLTDPEREALTALYDGEIAYVDSRIGELIGELERQGVLDETLVIITADHGENLGDHALMEHQFCLYQTLLHVPLIIRYPPRFPPGTRISTPVQVRDVFPTILKAANLVTPTKETEAARNLFRYGDGAELPPRGIVAEYASPTTLLEHLGEDASDSRLARSLRVFRSGPWKYVWSSDGQHELYELSEDRGEQHNRLHDEPARGRSMHRQLERWIASTPAFVPSVMPELLDEHRSQLRALGYIR